MALFMSAHCMGIHYDCLHRYGWLAVQVLQIEQAGTTGFLDVKDGCFLPYDYNSSPLLHKLSSAHFR